MKTKHIVILSIIGIFSLGGFLVLGCTSAVSIFGNPQASASDFDPMVSVAEWGSSQTRKGFVVRGFQQVEGFGRLVVCGAPDSSLKIVCREASGEELAVGDRVEFAAVSWLPVYSGTRCNTIVVRKEKD